MKGSNGEVVTIWMMGGISWSHWISSWSVVWNGKLQWIGGAVVGCFAKNCWQNRLLIVRPVGGTDKQVVDLHVQRESSLLKLDGSVLKLYAFLCSRIS